MPSRLALIKLILTRMEVPVSEGLNPDERVPAYVYGRLLAVFDEIQYAALREVNASVVDRFYGTLAPRRPWSSPDSTPTRNTTCGS